METSVQVQHSTRLGYKLLGPTDAKLLFELDQDPEVMRFITNGQITSIEKIHDVFLPRLAAYTNAKAGWGMWGVFSQVNDEFLGWILVRPMYFFSDNPLTDDIELGWRFKRHAWGQGYATEAAKQIMGAIQQQTGVTKFSAIAVKENTASINIMRKLGMKYVSSGLHKDPLGDMQVDVYSRCLESTDN